MSSLVQSIILNLRQKLQLSLLKDRVFTQAFFKKLLLSMILLEQVRLVCVLQMLPDLFITCTQSWWCCPGYLRSGEMVPLDELLDGLIILILNPSVFNSLLLLHHHLLVISYIFFDFIVLLFLYFVLESLLGDHSLDPVGKYGLGFKVALIIVSSIVMHDTGFSYFAKLVDHVLNFLFLHLNLSLFSVLLHLIFYHLHNL